MAGSRRPLQAIAPAEGGQLVAMPLQPEASHRHRTAAAVGERAKVAHRVTGAGSDLEGPTADVEPGQALVDAARPIGEDVERLLAFDLNPGANPLLRRS